jgi:hypothetical protein
MLVTASARAAPKPFGRRKPPNGCAACRTINCQEKLAALRILLSGELTDMEFGAIIFERDSFRRALDLLQRKEPRGSPKYTNDLSVGGGHGTALALRRSP